MKLDTPSNALQLIKNPSKITLAVSQVPSGPEKSTEPSYNIITLEWFMRTSIDPLMFAISVGHTRFSYQCLQKHRFFNLVYPARDMVDIAKYCGTKSGLTHNKFQELNLDTFSGKFTKLPIIRGSAATFECEIVTQVKSGDHTIFVGEVKHCWTDSTKEPLTYYDF